MSPVRTGKANRRQLEAPSIPLGWKLWGAFCALVSLVALGVAVWAVIKLVNHFTA